MTSKFNNYKNQGLTGLQNLGNTCFMNSTLQCLSHTYELSEFLSKNEGEYKNSLNKKSDSVIILEWDKLRELMWSSNCKISPQGFVKNIQKIAKEKDKEIFTGWAQNDLPEFLIFIIDCFHNSMNRSVQMNIKGSAYNDTDKLAIECYKMIKDMYSKDYSEMINIFYGTHMSKILDKDNNDVLSIKPEPYFMIDLPIPQVDSNSVDLFDCFNLYTTSELLSGDNAWFNEKTGEKQDVNKKLTFWSFPNILIISFRRFNNRMMKNNKNVSIPLENIDLSKYVEGYNKSSYVYDVYGVCNHTGGTSGGHYFAYVKNANGKWYCFNDMDVTPITDLSNIITNKCYCVFMRKR